MLAVITNASDLYVIVPQSMRPEESYNFNLHHHSSLQHKCFLVENKGGSVKERNNYIQFILAVVGPLVILKSNLSWGVILCYK